MADPTLKADEWIPLDILNDPRHLVRECDGCRHMLEEGLCGEDLHPAEEWAKSEGCLGYSPLCLEASGDGNPESPMDYQ